jgi:hypothetical protein
MQAMQNYAIGIVTARMTRAIIAMGWTLALDFCMTGESRGG